MPKGRTRAPKPDGRCTVGSQQEPVGQHRISGEAVTDSWPCNSPDTTREGRGHPPLRGNYLPESRELPPQRVFLGSWPTPLEPAPRLAEALGLLPDDLWIKRDDLTGLGGGGNKVRKLEWTIGHAIAQGADTLVTTGAPQSNHARLTAAAAARLNMDAVLIFPGERKLLHSGNVVLNGLFGARVAWAGKEAPDGLGKTAESVMSALRGEGRHPFLIPFGGSNAAGATGYKVCGDELRRQVPDLHTLVVALGSGGTMAGLVACLGAAKVLGIDTGAMEAPLAAVSVMASEAGQVNIRTDQLRARFDMVGESYSDLPESTIDAIYLTARTEGIVLDPVYTGRAMGGLVASVRDGQIQPGKKTVFLHTGGLPGLFGHRPMINDAESGLVNFQWQ
ncbi:pyridoxal-phosphate dependent enzyme [Arthrobacter sp. NPDC057013]|uniref:pyridoxal-phosphate dependent enzyme n=1 Tax=Arthrobacter sp. NPDC057013 TaxID=3345999 RepID=UPI003633B1F8